MVDVLRKISRIRFRRTRYKLRMLWSRVRREPLDVRLRLFFNFWAQHNRGEQMERDHLHLTEKTIQKMQLSSDDRILDLACGEGLAARLTARALSGPGHRVLGLDISDQMLRRARIKSKDFDDVAFVCASAEYIPCRDGFFTKIISIESFYYFEHQERVLSELFRVLAPSGWLFLTICHYADRPESLAFLQKLRVPTHVRSAAEYRAMLERGGWAQVAVEELIREPSADRVPSVHDRALLLIGQRPPVDPPLRS